MLVVWLVLLCFVLPSRLTVCLSFTPSIVPAAAASSSSSGLTSEVATSLGISSLTERDINSAIHHLKEAISLDGTNGEAYFHLGRSYQRQMNLAQASIAYRRAAELTTGSSNTDAKAKYELGKVLSDMGYIEEAVYVFRELISTEKALSSSSSQNGDCNVNDDGHRRPSQSEISLANALLDGLGQKEETLATYRQCCAYSENSALGLLAGITLDSMSNHDAAEEFYERASATQKLKEVEPQTALYWMLSKMRKGEEADAAILKGRLLNHVRASAEYVFSTPLKSLKAPIYYFTYDMIQLALQSSKPMDDGLILEFGVYHGKTIRMIAAHFTNNVVHGFDTFTGIPADWHSTPSGSYSTHGTVPSTPDNVEFHVGLFSETLPSFLEQHDGSIKLMNIDCDLYSSTKDVLDLVQDRIVVGTIIIFDEYVMNPNWKKDEYKAFQEAVQTNGWEYDYIAISLVTGQAIVRITKT